VGGLAPPHLSSRGVPGGGFWSPPLVGDLGAKPPKQNFGKNCLVKYCNFIVNLGHSL
jgi:hypothetical protein